MRTFLPACLIAPLLTQVAIAQVTSPETEAIQSSTANSPVAFIYVSNNPNNSSTNEIQAYAAAANGMLTPVPGSPFRDDVTSMAVNGKYLFGSTNNGIYIAEFLIEPNGALHWTRSKDIVQFNQGDCGSSGPLFLDHTGSTVYDTEFLSDCSNNSYQSLAVNKPTGQLKNMGATSPDAWLYLPASFIGNNIYAYSAGCLGDLYWEINGYKRSSDGTLSDAGINAPT